MSRGKKRPAQLYIVQGSPRGLVACQEVLIVCGSGRQIERLSGGEVDRLRGRRVEMLKDDDKEVARLRG